MALFTISDSSSTLAEITDVSGAKTLQTSGKQMNDNYTITANVPVYDNLSYATPVLTININSSTLTVTVNGQSLTQGSYSVSKTAPITLTSTAGLIYNNVLYAANTTVTINDLSEIAWIHNYSIGVDIVNTYSTTNYQSFSRVEVSSDLASYVSDITASIGSTTLSAGCYTVQVPCGINLTNNSSDTAYNFFLQLDTNIWQLSLAAGSSFGIYIPERSIVSVGVNTYYQVARLCVTETRV